MRITTEMLTRNIAKSGEVLNWGGFIPFQLHLGLTVNRSQSASCHIAIRLAIIKKTQKPINKRDMKKIINCLILIATITLISCEEVPDTPTNFIASQGTYIGVVHLAYGDLDGDAVVYRFNEENANWEEISWTSSSNFDDNGHDLPAPYLIPGKEYRYKMRVHSDGYSSYTNEITGYAFKGEPAEITSINRENNGNNTQYT